MLGISKMYSRSGLKPADNIFSNLLLVHKAARLQNSAPGPIYLRRVLVSIFRVKFNFRELQHMILHSCLDSAGLQGNGESVKPNKAFKVYWLRFTIQYYKTLLCYGMNWSTKMACSQIHLLNKLCKLIVHLATKVVSQLVRIIDIET